MTDVLASGLLSLASAQVYVQEVGVNGILVGIRTGMIGDEATELALQAIAEQIKPDSYEGGGEEAKALSTLYSILDGFQQGDKEVKKRLLTGVINLFDDNKNRELLERLLRKKTTPAVEPPQGEEGAQRAPLIFTSGSDLFLRSRERRGKVAERFFAALPDLTLDQILGISIRELPFSTHVHNGLLESRHQIDTLKDLVDKTREELLKNKNFGRKSLKEVEDFLQMISHRTRFSLALGGHHEIRPGFKTM